MVYPNATTGGRGVSWRLKWIYEFWGFCINGTSSLTVPGGMAPNGVNASTEFTTTSVMASGSDGYHPAVAGDLFSGDCLFTSQSSTPFTADMVGKALVIWKPNSNSSEDSIYVITQIINSSQIIININTGGTPNPVTKHPSMTMRTGVNYRVVDMETGAASPINGGFIVLQTDASSINAGQGNSQIQMGNSSSVGNSSSNNINFHVGISGPGSWNGGTLAITNATNATPIIVTTATAHGLTTGQTVSISGVTGNTNANGFWVITSTGNNTFSLVGSSGNGTGSSGTVTNSFANDGYSGITSYTTEAGGSYTAGQSAITMIGDKTFLICHIKEQSIFQDNLGLTIHFEIPQRLYPQDADRHPVAMMVQTIPGTGSGMSTSSTTLSYGGGFTMRSHSSDPTTIRKYRTLVKAIRGDGLPDVFGQNLSDYKIGYNTVAGTVPISDALLCLPGTINQYSLARVRLRTVKFTGTQIPKHHRLGSNGEFIQLQNGICWPWDNTIQVLQLLPFGGV